MFQLTLTLTLMVYLLPSWAVVLGGVSHPLQLTTGLVIKSVTTSPTFGRWAYASYSLVSIKKNVFWLKQNTIFTFFSRENGGEGGGGGDELSLRFILFLLHGLWGEFRLLPIRLCGVRLTQCSYVDAFVVDLVIHGCSFYGSTTFRMSTRRLPVILFVSRFECPLYPVVCCAVCLWWPRR